MTMLEINGISDRFKEDVYEKYIAHNGNVKYGLTVVDAFLKIYPYYPEALLFKARMLIALGRDDEALYWLETCEQYIHWNVECKYDKAEVLFKLGEKTESVTVITDKIEISLRDMLDGIENFLLGINYDINCVSSIKREIIAKMIRYLSNDSKSLDIDSILDLLKDHKTLPADSNCKRQKT